MPKHTHARKKHRRFSPAQRLIVLLLALIVCLSVAVVVLIVSNQRLRADIAELSDVSSMSQVDVSSSNVSDSTASKIPVSNVDPDSWSLRLANYENVLPSDFRVETGLITPAYARDQGMSFDARAVGHLNDMLASADADGVNLLVISCFRTMQKQTNLYNAEVQKWISQGYAEEAAKTKAATIVAVPGTSDHNLGLAVDLNSVEESFENTKQFTWLQAHAEEYGFVMRYPRDKEAVTKIIYEPWHYRYVGVDAAKEMNELNMCLEEYVAYLNGEYTPNGEN